MADVYPKPNPHGVWIPEACESLTLPGVGDTKRARGVALAHILVVQVGPSDWLEAADYQFHHGRCDGGGWSPNRTHSTGAPSRAEAIRLAAQRLLAKARGVLAERERDLAQAAAMEAAGTLPSSWWEYAVNASQEREARALEAWALQLLGGIEGQMDLFTEAAT